MSTPSPDGFEGGRLPPGLAAMSLVRWVLVIFMALLAFASVLYGTGAIDKLVGPGHGSAGVAKLYYCPMHPSVVQDHPGECPICSMTLVLKPESGATPPPQATMTVPPPSAVVPGLAPIDLTPERIQLTGMKTAPVMRQPLRSELRTVGAVMASERGLAQINTRFAGWIQQLFVSETGRQVRRGEALATVYSPDVLRAEQELLTARKWAASTGGPPPAGGALHGHDEATAGLADDARKRLELLGVAPQEIDDVARTGQLQRTVTIRSPVSGTVIRKNVVAGGYIQPGSELYAVADLSNVWVVAEVYEHEVARVRIGQPARLELAAYSGQTFKGRVQFLYPTIDADSRTMRIRLEFRNPGAKLKPGMYGTVHLDVPQQEGLVVPSAAVVDTGEMQVVFVAKGAGHFEPRRVKVGARADGHTQILEGVTEGETVVTTANFLVDSESRLRAAIEGQSSGDAKGSKDGASAPAGGACDRDVDRAKYPDKYAACRACEIQHRGMGTMEEDCKHTIAKPWR
jgi:membrane fusion protein, copper/silver efflux system